ncbi:MAG TPA: AAA family ATPase [Myxococcota bacterium]|nr:AAA family ATPase [Myxococcota bacterium]
MPEAKIKPLATGSLRSVFDPQQFTFKTTDELPDAKEVVGQVRALTAANFGINIDRDGWNIFALGPAGIGKRSIVSDLLEKAAAKKALAKDICYIHNFKHPRQPLVLTLTPGLGSKLAFDMQQLIEILRISIPAIFESKDYAARIKEIQDEALKAQEEALKKLEKLASSHHLTILSTPQGFIIAATKDNGDIISDKEFDALSEDERKSKEALMHDLHEHLQEYLEKIPQWQKQQREKVKEAFKYFTMLQVGTAIDELKKKYKEQPEIASYLSEVQQAILDNPNDFRRRPEGVTEAFGFAADDSALNRYRVNVLVDHSASSGAPIVFEDNPTFSNLVGRIDQMSRFGALVTDFTLIRAGALHKANGGYLLLDAVKLLTQPYAWEGLKRALRAKELRVENIYQVMGILGSPSLEPQSVSLDVKVVLFGDPYVYYLLCGADPDFLQLFKVAADFDEYIERNPKNGHLFASLLKNLIKRDNLLPLSKEAVSAVIDHASRMIGDSRKISTHVRQLSDLLHEADYYARVANKKVADSRDVEEAIASKRIRASRIKEEHYQSIERGEILIDTDGAAMGQINGLSYLKLGNFAFGVPTRITARVSAGKGELIDIERVVKLGGPLHSKGVLILAGYLRGQFSALAPWSLSASLVFEQSYGGVEGDSASAAEACALLSALAEVPIKQSIAITGSLNQHGHIQAIGGVNEKIEGFFDLCQERGFSGEQGVIIPSANIERLMLRQDVVLASKRGQFNIYAVSTLDEALALLTGLPAGARDSEGNFPKDSVYGKAEAALQRFAEKAKKAEGK